jgi:hypothetical protein
MTEILNNWPVALIGAALALTFSWMGLVIWFALHLFQVT